MHLLFRCPPNGIPVELILLHRRGAVFLMLARRSPLFQESVSGNHLNDECHRHDQKDEDENDHADDGRNTRRRKMS